MDKKKYKITWRKTDDLIPYARNARVHSDEQVAQIASSIKEFGWTNPILLDGDNGVIAGHGRLMAARKLEHKEVPTIDLHGLSEAQKRAYIIADNKTALNASWDFDILTVEFEELAGMDFDLALTGFGEVEIDAIANDSLDLSVLDGVSDDELEGYEANVRKAIQVEFEQEHFAEAQELFKFWREREAYVGGLIMDFLRAEKDKL
jgi:ParB-like chromosome segregation protein Spo0J